MEAQGWSNRVAFVDLEGRQKYFDPTRSIRWNVVAAYVDDETSSEAFLHRTKSGRYIHQIKQTSYCFELYGMFVPDPPERFVEVSLEEAVSMLLDKQRRAEANESPLPDDMVAYLRASCIDDEPLGEAPAEARAEQPKSNSTVPKAFRAQSGLAYCETLDGQVELFDLSGSQFWPSTGFESELYGSDICLTREGAWIETNKSDQIYWLQSSGLEVANRELTAEEAGRWFCDKGLAGPTVLVKDLLARFDDLKVRESVAEESSSRLACSTADSASVQEDVLVLNDSKQTIRLGELIHNASEDLYFCVKKMAEDIGRFSHPDALLGHKDVRVGKKLKELPEPLKKLFQSKPSRHGGFRMRPGYKVAFEGC